MEVDDVIGGVDALGNEESEEIIIESTEIQPEIVVSDEKGEKQSEVPSKKSRKEEVVRYRPLHLPLARIKQIIKMDPDVNLASSDAVFLIAKATELFIELLSKDSYTLTVSAKKKTIQKKDVDEAIRNTDTLVFLDGAMDT